MVIDGEFLLGKYGKHGDRPQDPNFIENQITGVLDLREMQNEMVKTYQKPVMNSWDGVWCIEKESMTA